MREDAYERNEIHVEQVGEDIFTDHETATCITNRA